MRGRQRRENGAGKWKSLLIYELEGRALSALIMQETEGRAERGGGRTVAPMWQLRVSQTNMRTQRERESEEGRQVQSEMESDSEMIKAAI